MQPHHIEQVLREAGRTRRRVRVRYAYHGSDGPVEHERTWEPYAIDDGHALVFSYFLNEFRRVPLHRITHAEVRAREFAPRRRIEM